MSRVFRKLLLIAISVLPAFGQDEPHWGVQGDGGYFFVPKFVVEEIHSLPEIPTINGPSFQTGLVRFNGRGAPSYAFQYSESRGELEGSLRDQRGVASLSGSATVRGFMATKYLNFFMHERISGGLAAGGGIGKLEGAYTRRVESPSFNFSELHRYDYMVPLFELLGRVDIRVVKALTVGPFYGIRDGMLGGGVSVRVHFTR